MFAARRCPISIGLSDSDADYSSTDYKSHFELTLSELHAEMMTISIILESVR